MSDVYTNMLFRSVNDTSRVVRMMIVSDATAWSIILMTLESSFMIVICLYYRPTLHGKILAFNTR
jgi:hypothetical protein